MEGDDFVFGAVGLASFADFPGEFDGGFVGFGAGVGDEDAGGCGHGGGGTSRGDKEGGEGTSPGVVVEVRGVDEGASLRNCQ